MFNVTHLFICDSLLYSDPRNRDDEFNDDSIDDVFNHSVITSPRNRDSSTPNSSPDTSPKKKDEGEDGKESATPTGGGASAAGDDNSDTSSQITEKAIVIVPSGQIVKETPEPSGGNGCGQEDTSHSNADDTTANTEEVPMETEELPLSTGRDPAGGDTVCPEDIDISVEENRAGQYSYQSQSNELEPSAETQTSSSSPKPSSTTTNTSLSSSSESGSGLQEDSASSSPSQSSSSSSQSSSSTETCDTHLEQLDTDNLSNSNNLGNSTLGDSSSDSSDCERPGGGAAAASRPDSLPVEDFNSFTFWRDPLPEIDIDADLGPNSQQAALKAAAEAANRAAAAAGGAAVSATTKTETSSSKETSNAEKLDEAAKAIEILSLNGGGGEARQAVGSRAWAGENQAAAAGGSPDPGAVNTAVHVASVMTSLEAEEETVTNIGSTHVLGQHPRETTMTVINGVVKGKLQRVTRPSFIPIYKHMNEPVVPPVFH